MRQRDVSIVFDMLPPLAPSLKPTLHYLSLMAARSNLSPWRQLAGEDNEETRIDHDRIDKMKNPDIGIETSEVEVEPEAQEREQTQKDSAIRWRYAEQGRNMHRIAFLDRSDPVFSRKSYIDGVAYMLMALPENLSNQETSTIRRALPRTIASTSMGGGTRGEAIDWDLIPEGRTILRRCVARSVTALVILIHLVLSCIAVVVHVATDYEHKHRILQRVVSQGIVIAAAVGGHGVVFSTKIYGMREGRVGKAVNRIVTWTVENVTYGIQEGLGEGLMMLDKGLREG
ncbi:hypothetical protein F4861DRAFT_273561 [Xylaria intraflava]|nr:hypothetical protein F4861DRAFT_273561 [Xylaria intraflava]